ncbi:MAG: polysaccharide ABC transporter ATP-binding protein [Bryobacteraceae bacterium]
MSDIAIRAEDLGKLYHIGERERYVALRDVMARTMQAPLRWLRRGNKPPNEDPTALWALKDVSFEIKRGDVVAILGRNGAGKSTLLKVLARVTKPTRGFAEVHGRMGSLLEVGTGFHPELTGRENVFLSGAILGMSKVEIRRKFDEIVAFSEVERFIDTPLKHYSSGMQMRLAFAVAAHLEPEILLIDEVLAVGDVQFQKKCLGKMGDVARQGRTILFVSHNLQQAQSICRSGILLKEGAVELQAGISRVAKGYLAESRHSSVACRVDTGALAFEGIANRALLDDVLPSQDLMFRLNFRNGPAPLEKVMIDFALHNDRGEYIVHSKSRLLDFKFSVPSQRQFEIVYEINSPRLAPGKYTLTVYVHDRGRPLLWIENIDACLIAANPCFGMPYLFDGVFSSLLPEFNIRTEGV